MTTRVKREFRLPALNHAAPLSPVPKTFHSALADLNWRAAMEEKHAALLQNHTWDLRQYMLDILDRAAMADCKPCSTLVDTNPKLAADGPLVKDASYFCSLAGAFQYLTFTRPNIAYTVQQSTSGYTVFLGDNLISWSSKRQNTVSRSSAKAEYRAVANGIAKATWLRQLLMKLHAPPRRASLVYCDNISAIYMLSNPVQHQRTKAYRD
nr:uncharacterized mitochondrial protein AtMg00810-like [Setaria viridis]